MVCVYVCAASITTVVCQSVKVSLLLQQAKTIPVLKTIISMGTEFPEEEKKLAAGVGISLYTFTEVMVSVPDVCPGWGGFHLE